MLVGIVLFTCSFIDAAINGFMLHPESFLQYVPTMFLIHQVMVSNFILLSNILPSKVPTVFATSVVAIVVLRFESINSLLELMLHFM